MHSLSKTLFHVVGIFCLLFAGALWYAALGDVKVLNELIDLLGKLRIAGYELGLFGHENTRFLVALVGSSVSVYFAVSFLVIGWMNGSAAALKVFSWVTGCLLGLFFCGLWFIVLRDDHILNNTDKYKLYGCSMFLGIGTIVLCWFGFRGSSSTRRRRVSPKKDLQDAPLPAGDDIEAVAPKEDIPSVETLLDDENDADRPSEGSVEGSESTAIEEDGAPPLPADGPPELPQDLGSEDDLLPKEAPPLPADGPADEASGMPPELPQDLGSEDDLLPKEAPPLPADEPADEVAASSPLPSSEPTILEEPPPLQGLESAEEKEVA